jgi:hypothetical protein
MKASDIPTGVWLAAAGVALVGFYVWKRGGIAGAAAGAVQAVGDAGAGAVIGAGQMVGIPATNADKCGQDLAMGDYWAASFSCPASRFLSARFGGAESPVDQSIMDPRDAMAQRGTGAGVAPVQEQSRVDYGLQFTDPQFQGFGA